MEILVLSNLFPPHVLGGYEILCSQVVDRLRARGHNVTVLTTSTSECKLSDPRRDVFRLLELTTPFSEPAGKQRWRRLVVGRRNARAIREYLLGRRFDLAFVRSQLRLTIEPLRELQAAGIPTVLTLNDDHLAGYLPARPEASPRRIVSHLLDRFVFRRTTLTDIRLDTVTCISHRLKFDLLEKGLPIEAARVIHQGIPIGKFPPKSRVGTIDSPLRLLYVGQLHPYKGVHTLIEAAHRLSSLLQGSPVQLSIAGTGPENYIERLKSLATKGDAKIELMGKLSHETLPALYRHHSIFVFPSTWAEPFGLTHLEAMASGTPVVSTADGGHAELMRDGENALVFEKGNAGELAAKLAEMATVPGLAKRIAKTARKDVEECFSMERYVNDLEALLARTIRRQP